MSCGRRKLLCEIIIVFILCVVILVYYVTNSSSYLETTYDHNIIDPVYLEKEKEIKYPIIVWWTPFTPFKREVKKCSLGTCIFTQSRTEYDNPLTEGFMFYGSNIHWKDLPLPRKQNHKWFLLHEESPKNDFILSAEDGISLFNYTATCSRYSSFPLVTQHLESIEWLLDPVRPTSLKSKGDIGLVMYLQSDCNAPSDRDTYVEELMKYVKVDSYGECVHNKDLPEHLRDPVTGMNSPDLIKIQEQYKFVLAIENAIADDYITEKLWRTFKAGSVPIYKGSPTVLDWTPGNQSLILATNFSSPKELAKYLLHLDEHDEEYDKYLSYKKGVTNERLLDHMKKRNYDINYETRTKPNMVDSFQCYVCDRMHERRKRIERGETLEPIVANKTHYNTYLPEPSLNLAQFGNRMNYPSYRILSHWKYSFKCGEYHAKAIKTAILQGAEKEEIIKILNRVCKIDWWTLLFV